MRAALTVECAPLGTSSLLCRKRKAARALRGHSRRILRRSRAHRPDQHIHSASLWRRMSVSNSRFTTKRLPWARRKVPSTSTHPSGRPPANRDGHRAQLQPDERKEKTKAEQERGYDGDPPRPRHRHEQQYAIIQCKSKWRYRPDSHPVSGSHGTPHLVAPFREQAQHTHLPPHQHSQAKNEFTWTSWTSDGFFFSPEGAKTHPTSTG